MPDPSAAGCAWALRLNSVSPWGKVGRSGRSSPLPGRLVLMPGYFYHGTQPTLSEEARVCVAFNVVPKELDTAPAGARER